MKFYNTTWKSWRIWLVMGLNLLEKLPEKGKLVKDYQRICRVQTAEFWIFVHSYYSFTETPGNLKRRLYEKLSIPLRTLCGTLIQQ